MLIEKSKEMGHYFVCSECRKDITVIEAFNGIEGLWK